MLSINSNGRTFGWPLNNAWYTKVHWLIGKPYLAIIANNECHAFTLSTLLLSTPSQTPIWDIHQAVPFLQSSKEMLLGYVVCPITGSIPHDSQLWRHLLTAWLEQTTATWIPISGGGEGCGMCRYLSWNFYQILSSLRISRTKLNIYLKKFLTN